MRKALLSGLVMMVWILVQSSWVQAEDFIKVKGIYWDSGLSGDIKASTQWLPGTKINLRDDLHVEKGQWLPEIEFKLNLPGMNKIIGSYWQTTYEGKKKIIDPINYAGISYASGEYLKTELNLEMTSLLYEWVFVPESLTRAFPSLAEGEIGLLLGIKYLRAEGKLSSSSSGTKSEDLRLPIPVIGLFAQFDFLQEKLRMELGGVGIGGSAVDYDFKFIDAYSEIKLQLTKSLVLGIGYKFTDLEIEKKNSRDFMTDLSLEGYYFFTTIKF